MGKSHRGKPLRAEVKSNFRGTCPITMQTGVKLLYEHEINGQKVMISKIGRATILRRQQKEALEKPKQAAPAAEKVAVEPAEAVEATEATEATEASETAED